MAYCAYPEGTRPREKNGRRDVRGRAARSRRIGASPHVALFLLVLAALLAAALGSACARTESVEERVRARAREVVVALKQRDVRALARIAHPDKGVRFSPYAFVHVDTDVVLASDEIENAFEDRAKRLWGRYDGSGFPILLTFAEYYEEFIYDRDFAAAEHVSYDERLGVGNTIDNSLEVYPAGHVVEYHFPADEGSLNWSSLRLVFEEKDGEWYLVGVIHDEWTI